MIDAIVVFFTTNTSFLDFHFKMGCSDNYVSFKQTAIGRDVGKVVNNTSL